MKRFEIYENNGGIVTMAILSESGDPLALFDGWELDENSIIPAIDALMEDEDAWMLWDGDALADAVAQIERVNAYIERVNARVSPEDRQNLLPMPTVESLYREISTGEWNELQAWGDTLEGLVIRDPWAMEGNYFLHALGDDIAEEAKAFALGVDDWLAEQEEDYDLEPGYHYDPEAREWCRIFTDAGSYYRLHDIDGSICTA